MSKKIQININEDYELSKVFNHIDNLSSSVESTFKKKYKSDDKENNQLQIQLYGTKDEPENDIYLQRLIELSTETQDQYYDNEDVQLIQWQPNEKKNQENEYDITSTENLGLIIVKEEPLDEQIVNPIDEISQVAKLHTTKNSQPNYYSSEAEDDIDDTEANPEDYTMNPVIVPDIIDLPSKLDTMYHWRAQIRFSVESLLEEEYLRPLSVINFKKEKEREAYNEVKVLFDLDENEIISAYNYLEKFKCIYNGCFILAQDVDLVETIGRSNYITLATNINSIQLNVQLIYWYLSGRFKNDRYKLKDYAKAIYNICPNSFCFNPDHFIVKTIKIQSSRSECFKNNLELMDQYDNKINQLEDRNEEYDMKKVKDSIKKHQCTHKVKCLGQFIQ